MISNLFAIDLNRRTRADLFVENHINALESQLTLVISKAVKPLEEDSQNQSPPIKLLDTNDTNNENNANDIPSQALSKPSQNRNRYSILNAQSRSHINRHILLMPNGSELQRGGKSFVLSNSCGFDCLASIYGTLYVDYPFMRSNIDNSTSKFAEFIKSISQQKKINSKIEFARFDLLKELIDDKKAIKEVKNLTHFNCETVLSGLFSSICKTSADILLSRQRISICSTCTIKNTIESPLFNSKISNFDYTNVQNSILSESTRVCDICSNKTMNTTEKFHDIVAIDCEVLRKSQQELISINSIENNIRLDNAEYYLIAAIEFNPMGTVTKI